MSGRRTKKQLSQSEANKTDAKSVKPKSKRRHLTIAVIVGIVALASIGTALWLSGVVKLGNLGRVIADRTYANWAWGFTYGGTLITDTGHICKVELGDEQKSAFMDASEAGLAKFSDYLLSHAYCYEMVSGDDLSRLKELADKIDEYNLVTDGVVGHTIDAGSTCASAWNYEAGKIYDIDCTGDMVGSNPSDEAQELIQIINKYLGE